MSKKISDKIKYFMGVDSEDVDNEEEYYEEDYEDYEEEVKGDNYNFKREKKDNVLNMNNSKLKVVVYKPTEFPETKKIVDNLKAEKPVIINISKLENPLAKKIFDFCSGALYALDGHINKIENGIFLLAPKNIDVVGNLKEELQEKGMFDWLKDE